MHIQGMRRVQKPPAPADRWGAELHEALALASSQADALSLLLSRHIPVFPCVPGGKTPLTAHGFHDATADIAQVGPWWTRWPDANIGVPTGARSGIDVVDVDVHPLGSGFAAFERARLEGLVDGWSWLVRTPSGGVHAYFPSEPGREQRSWQVPGKHIDFRGDGGYIIVPPSAVADSDGSGGVYRSIAVATHHEPAPMDARALRAFLDPPKPMARPIDAPALDARPERLAAWVASRHEGGRNAGLFWAACRMVEQGLDFPTTAAMLSRAGCEAGLSERESITTIRSAYRVAAPAAAPCANRSIPVEAVGR
ncbi:hypothetical protein GCM10009725_03880 [Aeromicrobium tamlense]